MFRFVAWRKANPGTSIESEIKAGLHQIFPKHDLLLLVVIIVSPDAKYKTLRAFLLTCGLEIGVIDFRKLLVEISPGTWRA